MIENVIQAYFPGLANYQVSPFGQGHINDTYKLSLGKDAQEYILQRINTKVFHDPESIAQTHLKIQALMGDETEIPCIARLIPDAQGNNIVYDSHGGAWRLTSFIKDSYSVDVVLYPWQAYQAGIGYGWFVNHCSSLNPAALREAIPNFHNLSFRLHQLDDAIKEDRAERKASVADILSFFQQRRETLLGIEALTKSGHIPIRVVHNDTKINNLLFANDKAVAVIDLDTAGPGILYYDYGDALRTSANAALEDEPDTTLVGFNLDLFAWFTKGYLQQTGHLITKSEMEYLHLAPVLMTYIMGIRFLADYLNGDVYYKIHRPDHNLIRCLVQQHLIMDMERKSEDMQSLIKTNQNI